MFSKKFLYVSLLLGFITIKLDAQELDSLISRINRKQTTYDMNSDYTCLITSKEHTMDKNWNPKKTKIIEKKFTKNQENRSVDIIRAVEVKKNKENDITDEIKKEMNEKREKEEEEKEEEEDQEEKRELKLGLNDMNPFDVERRDQFNFTLLSDTLVNTHRYSRIQTKAKEPSKDLYEGIYWIDSDTYALTYMEIYPSQNPKFVKELRLKFWFEEMEPNHWMPVQIWTRVFVSILIKKIRIQTEEVYSNYRF